VPPPPWSGEATGSKWDATMRDRFTGARKIATRIAPATIAAAAAAFSLGAYSGDAATLFGHKPIHPTFTLTMRKRTVTLDPGSTARLAVVIHRRRLRVAISFKVLSRLPRGVAVRFAPRRTRGRRTSVILRVSGSAAPGRYRLRLRARAGRIRRTTTLTLKVVQVKAATPSSAGPSSTGQSPDFSITGSVAAPLEPGSPAPVDVLITNPNDLPLTISSLSVVIQTISAPQATPALPCTAGDFAVAPYTGQVLSVPASSSRTLAELGVPSSQWPEVGVIDRPTNQDGCQGASLGLTYAATARLG
jgi:hypothetical protein